MNSDREECHLSCPCHNAKEGSRCHGKASYAIYAGIKDHPEWYYGLHNNSKFGAVQLHLHEYDNSSECDMPCADALAEALTFFCFSVVRPNYEYDIVKNQFAWNAGIFACDGFAVLAEEKLELGWSLKGPIETIVFSPAPVGISKDGTAANALLFMRAWEVIKLATPYEQYDWTLKVDPDAVLLPDRLRMHLAPLRPDDQVYVKNCNKWPEREGWPMMFGSIEIFSSAAVTAYLKGQDACKKNLPWDSWGEDYFMNQCLGKILKVRHIEDGSVLSDKLCKHVDCNDPWAAVFHPFKDRVSWMECWRNATPNSNDWMLPHEPPPLPKLRTASNRSNYTNHTNYSAIDKAYDQAVYRVLTPNETFTSRAKL